MPASAADFNRLHYLSLRILIYRLRCKALIAKLAEARELLGARLLTFHCVRCARVVFARILGVFVFFARTLASAVLA